MYICILTCAIHYDVIEEDPKGKAIIFGGSKYSFPNLGVVGRNTRTCKIHVHEVQNCNSICFETSVAI